MAAEGPYVAPRSLFGLYASCHAGRSIVSPLITSATVWIDSTPERGTCIPSLATRMRDLEITLGETPDPCALRRMLLDPHVRACIAQLQRLSVRSGDAHYRDGATIAPFDLAAIAEACPPSLPSLALSPCSAACLDLSVLTTLTGLQSLDIRDHQGNLTGASLCSLAPLASLTLLDVGVSATTAANTLFPSAAGLSGLARLNVEIYGPRDAEELPAPLLLGAPPLDLSPLSLLSCLRHLTRLDVDALQTYREDQPEQHLPLHQYLRPFCCLRTLVHLELRLHLFSSFDGLLLLQRSLPHLTDLFIWAICIDEPSPAAPDAALTAAGALRRLRLHQFVGSADALLAIPMPPAARVRITSRLCLLLGLAQSPDDVAAVAEALSRAVEARLDGVQGLDLGGLEGIELELAWDAAPDAAWTPERVLVAALLPLGRHVASLQLDGWRLDGELLARAGSLAPGVTEVVLKQDCTAATGQVWQALGGLAKLERVRAFCVLDLYAMAAWAARAPKLQFVGFPLSKSFVVGGPVIQDVQTWVKEQRSERGLEKLIINVW